MCPIRQRVVHADHNTLDLIPPSPLRIARMAIDPPHVLPNLRLNTLEDEVIDRVQCVGEDELRPREDAQLVARRVKVVPARECVRRLVDAPTPNAELPRRKPG